MLYESEAFHFESGESLMRKCVYCAVFVCVCGCVCLEDVYACLGARGGGG